MPAPSTADDNAFDFEGPSRPGAAAAIPGDNDLSEIYLAALAHPVLRRDDLLTTGFNEADISESIPVLEARGMIRRLDASSWRVLPPDIALPAFATRLEDRARAVRSTVAAMTQVFEQHTETSRGLESFEGIRIMTTLADVREAIVRVLGTAQTQVMTAYADSPVSRELLAATRDIHERVLVNSSGNPIDVQANYSSVLLNDPGFPELMQWRADAGEEQRVTPGLRMTCMVNDTGMSLVHLKDENGAPHGLMIADRALSFAIREVCRWAWHIGVDWHPEAAATDRTDGEAQARNILRMMAAGASDAAIARHLKISQRTVERRVRAIMDRLNATTRFQAGVLAARHNLL